MTICQFPVAIMLEQLCILVLVVLDIYQLRLATKRSNGYIPVSCGYSFLLSNDKHIKFIFLKFSVVNLFLIGAISRPLLTGLQGKPQSTKKIFKTLLELIC